MIKSLSLLNRKPDLSHEEFVPHWVEIHLPRLRRAETAPLRAVAHRCGSPAARYRSIEIEIDGIAELWYDDLEAMTRANASPEAKALHADGATFIGQIKSFTIEERTIIPRP